MKSGKALEGGWKIPKAEWKSFTKINEATEESDADT